MRATTFAANLFLTLTLIAVTTMGRCDAKWEWITPDGQVLDLSEYPGLRTGTAQDALGFEDEGLPPVKHVTQRVYNQIGDTLRAIVVMPRIFSILVTAWATDGTRQGLHESRAVLNDNLRWDRTALLEPSTIRYTLNEISRDLRVHYAGDVKKTIGRDGTAQTIGIRLAAHDPLWYATEDSWAALSYSHPTTAGALLSYTAGHWTEYLGAAAGVGTGIYAIAVDPATGDIYVGGDFASMGGVAGTAYIAMYDVSAAAWVSVGGGLSDVVEALEFGPDGLLYVGGAFRNAGGDPLADSIATWDGIAYANLGGVGAAGAGEYVAALCFMPNGDIYIGGNFLNFNAIAAADYIVMYDYSAAAYVAVAAGCNGIITEISAAPDDSIYVSGGFGLWGTAAYIAHVTNGAVAKMDGTLNDWVGDHRSGPDGKLYLVGDFTNAGTDPEADYHAVWDGYTYAPLPGCPLTIDTDVVEYHEGIWWFQDQSGAPGTRWWSGASWMQLPATELYVTELESSGGTMYAGGGDHATAGTILSAETDVVIRGNVKAYPIIRIYNFGRLNSIHNTASDEKLWFKDFDIADGEIVTIDLNPGVKTMSSPWRSNLLHKLQRGVSDLVEFGLDPAPTAPAGVNPIACFMTDTAAREAGDNNNQLSGWDTLTGVTTLNSTNGYLYVSIIADGGGFYHTALYSDVARTELVGHTASYNGAGAQAIVADNDSGLGGTITVDAVVAVDTTIRVTYTLIEMTWRDQYWDLDNAVYIPLVLT